MQKIKKIIKKALKIDYTSYLKPLKKVQYIGSHYHGYYIPSNLLNENSVCYCVGAGEDVTFDTELVVNYNAKVFIFDPAPEGINHFAKLNNMVKNGEALSVGSTPFTYRISAPQLDKITYIETGVWSEKTLIKFYKPTVDNYASHSIELFNASQEYIEVPVDRLSNLMRDLKHKSIDLFKMEIEGAEYAVIKTIVEDKPDIKIILVEFDEVYHPKDSRYVFRIKEATKSLIDAGYTLAHSTPHYKKLFVRNDVFEALKAKEN